VAKADGGRYLLVESALAQGDGITAPAQDTAA
jgi:hypothetical protein